MAVGMLFLLSLSAAGFQSIDYSCVGVDLIASDVQGCPEKALYIYFSIKPSIDSFPNLARDFFPHSTLDRILLARLI